MPRRIAALPTPAIRYEIENRTDRDVEKYWVEAFDWLNENIPSFQIEPALPGEFPNLKIVLQEETTKDQRDYMYQTGRGDLTQTVVMERLSGYTSTGTIRNGKQSPVYKLGLALGWNLYPIKPPQGKNWDFEAPAQLEIAQLNRIYQAKLYPYVEWLYHTYLNRDPDREGYDFWFNKMANNEVQPGRSIERMFSDAEE